LNDNKPSEFTLSKEHFKVLSALLLERYGLYFDETKSLVMRNALRERLSITQMSDTTSYLGFLRSASSDSAYQFNLTPDQSLHPPEREFRRLLELLTVNETQFFRNKDHFRALREKVLPELIKRNQRTRSLRIWSAGCSTGPEPYSLAIMITDLLREMGYTIEGSESWKIEIIGTDISERALRVAEVARYRRDDLRSVEPQLITRFFLPVTSERVETAPLDPSQIIAPGRAPLARGIDRAIFRVVPEIKGMVKFYFFNLTSPVYPANTFSNFDLVMCENVTIYFTPEVTRRVIANIHQSMQDGAYLFIGYSETLWQISNSFRLVNSHDTFFYQKPSPGEGLQVVTPKSAAPAQSKPQSSLIKPSVKIGSPTSRPPTPVPPQELVKRLSKPLDSPETWEDKLAAGQDLMNRHEFQPALNYLQQALQMAPEQPGVLLAIAHLKTKLGKYEEAAKFSLKVIAHDPLSEDAHLILALIHLREGRINEAIEEFQKTIYINLDSVIAHLSLGDIYRNQGQVNPALREYRNALTALEKRRPDEIIEDLPVPLLKQTCEQNIRSLQKG
jgi:chemotaxis protein methyltransferase CheR